jgi:hypothetical protein
LLTVRGSIHTSFTDGPSYLTGLGRSLIGGATVAMTDDTIAACRSSPSTTPSGRNGASSRGLRERRRDCTAGLHGAANPPVIWGLAVGVAQAATPLAFWWLDTATVYALGLAVIASVYIGFAVADGRRAILAVEIGVAGMFVIIAAAAVTNTPWLLVAGLAGHGFKDLWQHRSQFVANTRWWPPFCLVVDWAVAAIIAAEIVAGIHFHH